MERAEISLFLFFLSFPSFFFVARKINFGTMAEVLWTGQGGEQCWWVFPDESLAARRARTGEKAHFTACVAAACVQSTPQVKWADRVDLDRDGACPDTYAGPASCCDVDNHPVVYQVEGSINEERPEMGAEKRPDVCLEMKIACDKMGAGMVDVSPKNHLRREAISRGPWAPCRCPFPSPGRLLSPVRLVCLLFPRRWAARAAMPPRGGGGATGGHGTNRPLGDCVAPSRLIARSVA